MELIGDTCTLQTYLNYKTSRIIACVKHLYRNKLPLPSPILILYNKTANNGNLGEQLNAHSFNFPHIKHTHTTHARTTQPHNTAVKCWVSAAEAKCCKAQWGARLMQLIKKPPSMPSTSKTVKEQDAILWWAKLVKRNCERRQEIKRGCCMLLAASAVAIQRKRPGESAEEKTRNERRTTVAGSRLQDAQGRTQDLGNQCILSFVIKLLRDNAASGEMNF